MTNETLLRQKMEESGYKFRFIAKRIGITYQGFLNKAQNKTAFTAPEIQALTELLKLTLAEKEAIFFAPNVD